MAPDQNSLKKAGIIQQRQRNYVTLRLMAIGGNLSSEQLATIARLAKSHAQGFVHFNYRQALEIPNVRMKDVDALRRELLRENIYTGVDGVGVQAVMACNGTNQCVNGNIDPYSIAYEITSKYMNRELPGEIKIGVAGCLNNCFNAETNDIGIKGGLSIKYDKHNCASCSRCEEVCEKRAISFSGKDLFWDKNACNSCGACVRACQYDALDAVSSYYLFFGGVSGERIATGYQLFPATESRESAMGAVDAAIAFYVTYARHGETFRSLIDRVGKENLREYISQVVPNLRK